MELLHPIVEHALLVLVCLCTTIALFIGRLTGLKVVWKSNALWRILFAAQVSIVLSITFLYSAVWISDKLYRISAKISCLF